MQDLPESRGILVLLLLVDMINTFVQELIQAINCNEKASAVAAVSIFGILNGIFILIAICNSCYLCYDKHEHSKWNHLSLAIQAIGATLYFLGDHLSVLLSRHGNELCCDTECCLANSKIAGVVCQGVALVIFLVVPPAFHKLISECRDEPWYTPIDAITMILKIDTLYSMVITMVESPDSCSDINIAVSTVFLGLLWIMGCIYGSIYIYRSVDETEIRKVKIATAIIIVCVSMLCLPFYLLVDNNLPLDCVCRYDANMTVNSTQTFNMTHDTTNTCNQGVSIGRLVSIFIIFFIFIVPSSVILFSIYETENKTRGDNSENGMMGGDNTNITASLESGMTHGDNTHTDCCGKCSSYLDSLCGSVCCGIQYIGSCFREKSKIHPELAPGTHSYQDQETEL